MKIIDVSFKYPYLVIAVCMAVVLLGIESFLRTPVDLFPDTAPPQVLVLTMEPGASARDVSDKITETIEKEIYTISGIKMI